MFVSFYRIVISRILVLIVLITPGVAQADLQAAFKAYDAEDYETAAKLLPRYAEQGHTEAIYRLAWLYSNGQGVEQDQDKAFHLFNQAAQMGHIIAAFSVGIYYDFGEGNVKKNLKKAFEMYMIAAQAGFSRAEFNIGNMLINGHGVAKDLSTGMRWLTTAARRGDRDALGLLGSLHYQRKAPNSERTSAWMFLDLASRLGKAPATVLLNLLKQQMTTEQVAEAKRLQAEWLRDATFIPPPRER